MVSAAGVVVRNGVAAAFSTVKTTRRVSPMPIQPGSPTRVAKKCGHRAASVERRKRLATAKVFARATMPPILRDPFSKAPPCAALDLLAVAKKN